VFIVTAAIGRGVLAISAFAQGPDSGRGAGFKTLADRCLVHEHQTFWVSDFVNDKSEFEEAFRALQCFCFVALYCPTPSLFAGAPMHVPPDRPIHGRSLRL
jgi:hypothetical protein